MRHQDIPDGSTLNRARVRHRFEIQKMVLGRAEPQGCRGYHDRGVQDDRVAGI